MKVARRAWKWPSPGGIFPAMDALTLQFLTFIAEYEMVAKVL